MKFIIDAQLPPSLFNWINNTENYSARHVQSLERGLTSSDSEIWKIALKEKEVIVTKDIDFFDRAVVSDMKPRVLHLTLGNCSNKQLIEYLATNWKIINDIFKKNHKIITCSYNNIDFW